MKRPLQLLAFAGTIAISLALWTSVADAAPISCGMVITTPGIYTLGSNLTCSGFFAVQVVGAGGVTIDLDNHTLAGSGGASFGIDIEQSAATVQNGVIRGFVTGVLVNGRAQVTNTRLTKNTVGLSIAPSSTGGNSAVVQSSFANENSGDGITVSPDTLLTISDSQVNGNGGNGITAGSAPIDAARNVISRNGGYGIYQDGFGVTLSHNLLSNNGRDGVYLGPDNFPDSYTITYNTALANGGHGIVYQADELPLVVHVLHREGNVAAGNLLNPQCVNIFCLP
jgi:hypothetical protein